MCLGGLRVGGCILICRGCGLIFLSMFVGMLRFFPGVRCAGSECNRVGIE